MTNDLPEAHSKPSEQPVYTVYQLKEGIEQSDHIEDYNMVGLITAPDTAQALASVRMDDWETHKSFTPKSFTPLLDSPHTSIRPSTFRDVIGIPKKKGGYELVQITNTPERITKLKPFQFDKTPREKLKPTPIKVEAAKIRKAPETKKLKPEDSPDKPKKPKL